MVLTIVDVAAMCHAANREVCAAQGDHSQLPWSEAPTWAKDSAIAGVRTLMLNPGMTPEQSHQAWLDHKLTHLSFRGVMKNEATKEHPCFVPYDELPAEQQLKDHVFSAIVEAARPFTVPPTYFAGG